MRRMLRGGAGHVHRRRFVGALALCVTLFAAAAAGADQDRRRHGRARAAAMAAIHRRGIRLAQAGQDRARLRHRRRRRRAAARRRLAQHRPQRLPGFRARGAAGRAAKIIISDFIGSPYAVFAKPNIKQIADLKGKLISIGGINDITLIYIKPFLASAGLKTSDVDFVYAKAAGDRFSALVSGGVDATILNPPTYFKAIAPGFSNLGDTKPYAEDIPFTVWAANSAWAAKNRDALTAFARNYKRGGALALRSGQQAAGDRHSGEARQAGPQGLRRRLRLSGRPS